MTRIEVIDLDYLKLMAFTQEMVEIVAAKINQIQGRIDLPFLIENIGTFQIPVDSAEETSGGDMMVIARES